MIERHWQRHEDFKDATVNVSLPATVNEIPIRVREAAVFLGVSPQTVYLCVERKQIPPPRDGPQHPVSQIGSRALPRNFQTGGGNWQDPIYPRKDGKVLWMVHRDRSGKRIRESTFTEDWQEAQRKLRERLQARDDKILDVVRKGEQLQFADWVDFFLENYSKPPIRAEKTHEANKRAGLHLKQAFGQRSVGDISADDIENYLRRRLQTHVQVKTAAGFIQKDRLKTATVHQELGFFAV